MTIKTVARRFNATGIVVIHDFEREANRKAAAKFKHRFIVTAFNPSPGIAWSECAINPGLLRGMNRFLSSCHVQPDDVTRWKKAAEAYLDSVNQIKSV